MSGDPRTAVLERIRAALGKAGDPTIYEDSAEWAALPRDYDQAPRLSSPEKLNLLEDRLRDYDAEVTRVSASDLAAAIAAVLSARGNRPTLVPPGLPAEWLPNLANLVVDQNFTPRELDRLDGVVTTATLAIAETGSIVLQNIPGQGRRAATLVPDFHLCVVRAGDVVETVPEAFARLARSCALPTTFISGPSATADIEMTRIKGVHGPRFLHVLLVTE